jgi:hypothetical protein
MALPPVIVARVAGVEVPAAELGVPFPDSAGDGFDGWEGPDYMTNPWDLAVLNGIKVPGITQVKCTGKKKIDIPKATGRDGGPTTDRGHIAATIEITNTVWTPSQWRLWQQVEKAIWRPPGSPVVRPEGAVKGATEIKAITISHPSCSPPPRNVSAILIESFESSEWSPQKGMVTRIKAVQYIEPKKANVTRAVSGGVPLTKEFAQAKAAAPANPVKTDAVPVLPRLPDGGPI